MTDRKQHWEQVYSDKMPAEVSWFQARPTLSLACIRDCMPDTRAAIIDVGGGASRLVDHLLEHGYSNLAVLDISAGAIAETQKRLGSRADRVEWFVDDITTFEAPRKYHLWHDRAVFHFLTHADDRVKYVQTLNRTLEPGGDVIIATFAIGGPQKCSGLDIEQYDEQKIQKVLGDDFELRDVKHELHRTPRNDEQAFIYFHLRKMK